LKLLEGAIEVAMHDHEPRIDRFYQGHKEFLP